MCYKIKKKQLINQKHTTFHVSISNVTPLYLRYESVVTPLCLRYLAEK